MRGQYQEGQPGESAPLLRAATANSPSLPRRLRCGAARALGGRFHSEPLGVLLLLSAALAPAVQLSGSPLHDTAAQGDIAKVNEILDQGTNIETRAACWQFGDGLIPLPVAVEFGREDVGDLPLQRSGRSRCP